MRRTWSRFTRWLTRKEPPSGPGPGGGPLNNNFERARAESEFHRMRDGHGGGFGSV